MGGHRGQFRHGQGRALFDIVHPAFLLPSAVSPTLHVALRGGFGEAVVVHGMLEPREFPSLDSCQNMFLSVWKVGGSSATEVSSGQRKPVMFHLGTSVHC